MCKFGALGGKFMLSAVAAAPVSAVDAVDTALIAVLLLLLPDSVEWLKNDVSTVVGCRVCD